MAGWKDIVGTVAPALATALGGPLAGLGVAAIGKALGLGDSAGEEDVAQAVLRATPEQLVAVKRAEMDFTAKMKELDVDLARIAVADRQSARRRESATGDSWTPRLLAAVALGAFVACIWMVFQSRLTGMDAAQIALIGGVVGYASAKADTVIAYYFGSSKGSDDANRLLYKSTPNPGD